MIKLNSVLSIHEDQYYYLPFNPAQGVWSKEKVKPVIIQVSDSNADASMLDDEGGEFTFN